MRSKTGITLVALVITIIVLLILAGVSIAVLANNGLLGNAETAKQKYHNSQIEENEVLADYENKIAGGYVGGARETASLEGVKMKLLTTASEASKQLATYPLSSFIRTDTDISNNYIEYDSDNDYYVVKKSGWYIISMSNGSTQNTGYYASIFSITLNDEVVDNCDIEGNCSCDRNNNSLTIYLTKGNTISCKKVTVGNAANDNWNKATMKIYALDK